MSVQKRVRKLLREHAGDLIMMAKWNEELAVSFPKGRVKWHRNRAVKYREEAELLRRLARQLCDRKRG